MKKILLTLALVATGLFANAQQPTNDKTSEGNVTGTNFTYFINYTKGFGNVVTRDVRLVTKGNDSNNFFSNTNPLFAFTPNDEGSFTTRFIRFSLGQVQTIDVQVQGMFNYDKSTLFNYEGSTIFRTSGNFGLGNSKGKIFGIRNATTFLVKVTVPSGAWAVYEVKIVGGNAVMDFVQKTIKGLKPAPADPFGPTNPFGPTTPTPNNPFEPKTGGPTTVIPGFGPIPTGTPTTTITAAQAWAAKYNVANLNQFDLHAFLTVFVKDAKENFGLDFSYIYNYEVDLEFNSTVRKAGSKTIAYTDALGDNKRVHIVVIPAKWSKMTPAERLAVMYHELGHDILNLDHKAEKGPLMSVYATRGQTFDQLFELRKEMFADYLKK